MLCKKKKKESVSVRLLACFGQELVDNYGSKHDDYWCLAEAQERDVALNSTDNVQGFEPCIVCTTELVITEILQCAAVPTVLIGLSS